MTTPLLAMHNITKRFPGVLANDNVSFDVLPGEVHTLLGENGAGKSHNHSSTAGPMLILTQNRQ